MNYVNRFRGREQRGASSPNEPNLFTKFKNPQTRNIIVFGGRGAGKSSIINMLAGGEVAPTGGDPIGTTTGNVSYTISIKDSEYVFWDTAGLNEGNSGIVKNDDAFYNLGNLVGESDGVSLLVYCVFGSRVGLDYVEYNYDLFVRKICADRIPVVLVITGLENEKRMEDWWGNNKAVFSSMSLESHACVTTIKGRQDAYKKEYSESTAAMQAMIKKYCSRSAWKVLSKESWTKHVALQIQGDSGLCHSDGARGKLPSDQSAPSGKDKHSDETLNAGTIRVPGEPVDDPSVPKPGQYLYLDSGTEQTTHSVVAKKSDAPINDNNFPVQSTPATNVASATSVQSDIVDELGQDPMLKGGQYRSSDVAGPKAPSKGRHLYILKLCRFADLV
ncbi:hypothetical protein D9756_010519 [Leucocoprinus leucothites]|uniref:G domain-containing protein n=1 Tax=Leucocoprinus leucothites TaxID=201217 RepID=A0A8H5CVE5_9AGAR|nr:hypothetical protein D9756_010519 [Leucoagaricus leucothites]